MDNLREKYERDASRRKREGEDDLWSNWYDL